MEHEKIERINELARKKKSTGLTEEETAEHEELSRVRVQQADGSYLPLVKKKPN